MMIGQLSYTDFILLVIWGLISLFGHLIWEAQKETNRLLQMQEDRNDKADELRKEQENNYGG